MSSDATPRSGEGMPANGDDRDDGQRIAGAGEVQIEFALGQYNSLRSEILQLISLQSQLIGGDVVAFGVLLSVAAQVRSAGVILVYPVISLVLGILWLNHARAIIRIGNYIAAKVEPLHLNGIEQGWESYLRTLPSDKLGRLGYWGVRLTFPCGSFLALIAALLLGVHGSFEWTAFALSASLALICIAMFVVMREESHEIMNPKP